MPVMMFNGCSYVHNIHLHNETSDWYNQNWPALVSAQLGYDYKNISMSGASNTRIFRTSVDAILNKECDTLIIGWTNKEREEIPHHTGDYVRLMPGSTGLQHTTDAPNYHDAWYKHHHNEWLSLYQLVRYIVVIQQLCDHNNIKLLMFNSIWGNSITSYHKDLKDNYYIKTNRYGEHHQELDAFEKLYKQIDFDRWVLPGNQTLAQIAKDMNLDFDSTGHLKLSAQRPVADEFVKRLNTV